MNLKGVWYENVDWIQLAWSFNKGETFLDQLREHQAYQEFFSTGLVVS
jgi:hypothetical protein